jgi:hypothetical protein
MNIAKDGRFVCYGPRAAATATRWSAIRRSWPMMCWMKSSPSRLRSGITASWCRPRALSTALQQRKHASGVLADVRALSRLKHGFESRRERQYNQRLRLEGRPTSQTFLKRKAISAVHQRGVCRPCIGLVARHERPQAYEHRAAHAALEAPIDQRAHVRQREMIDEKRY